MRYRRFTLAASLLVLLAGCFDTGPVKYANLGELTKYEQEEKGYEVLDCFGEAWPAVVQDERTRRESYDVILANGQMHSYDEPGKVIKVIKLQGPKNAEIVVVLRSK